MDLAVYQDLFLNLDVFGQGFNAALQTAIDAWAQGFDFFGGNAAGAEAGAGAEAEFAGLSSQFGLGAEAAASAPEADEAGLELNLDAGLGLNL